MKKSVLVVYHTQSGSCARLAQAICEGVAAEPEVLLVCRRAWDATTRDLAASSGLLLVMAENSGAMSGAMKDFLDRSLYPSIARELVRPYGLVISAGNDGRNAVTQAQRILSGFPYPAAMEPLIQRGDVSSAQLQTCRELGEAFAAGISMGIY